MLTAATGAVNEMRAGTYVYGDRQQAALGAVPADGCAVAVAATVVSAFADRLVVDAGAKALTKDRADWLIGFGAIAGYPDLVIERVNDYHGVVAAPVGVARPRLGDHPVFAPGDRKPHRLVAAGAGVELVEVAAQPVHRDPHRGVLRTVEGGAAGEHRGGHLELLGPGPGDRAVGQVVEQAVQSVGAAQGMALPQARRQLRDLLARPPVKFLRQSACNLL